MPRKLNKIPLRMYNLFIKLPKPYDKYLGYGVCRMLVHKEKISDLYVKLKAGEHHSFVEETDLNEIYLNNIMNYISGTKISKKFDNVLHIIDYSFQALNMLVDENTLIEYMINNIYVGDIISDTDKRTEFCFINTRRVGWRDRMATDIVAKNDYIYGFTREYKLKSIEDFYDQYLKEKANESIQS